MNMPKLCWWSAMPAITAPIAALIDASEKPRRRPILFIKTVAGIVVAATQRTIIETGRVASVGSVASFDPMMPPRVTMMMAPVAEISWQHVRIMMFFSGMGIGKAAKQRILTYSAL
jgi:hypothetical protein